MRALAVAAVALLGLAFALTPTAERADARLLDAQWSVLRKFDPTPAPDDIIVVGIDDTSHARIGTPPGLWHVPLGEVLVRLASAGPRAIGLDLPLPERSYDDIRPGMDRALMTGLAAARRNGPLVAALSIDARSRAARPIHAPFLAVLGEEGLGIGLIGRDDDGVTRRFSIGIPTEDGAYPTLAGRLCRAMSRHCDAGLIHFALGPPYRYVPLQQVLDSRDPQWLQALFRDRIVLLGETRPFTDRIAVPANFAGWESDRGDSPAVVVHAQSLRTALAGAAPMEASRALVMLAVGLAALLVLMRDWRLAWVSAALGAALAFAGAVVSLRAGLFVPIAGVLATLLLGAAALSARGLSRRFVIRRR